MNPDEALRDVRAELREVDPVDGVVEAAHAFVLAAEVERLRAIEKRAIDIRELRGDVGDAPKTAHWILTGEDL